LTFGFTRKLEGCVLEFNDARTALTHDRADQIGTQRLDEAQLVTGEVDHVDDYRNVLLGFASTLTFTDPSLMEVGMDSGAGSAAAEVRSPFG